MGRASTAPGSVAETASEDDWLMATIAEGKADGTDVDAHGDDKGQLCMSQVEDSQTIVTKAKAHDVKPGVVDDGELSITYWVKEQSADHAGHPDSQVSSTFTELKPLQAFPSLTSRCP